MTGGPTCDHEPVTGASERTLDTRRLRGVPGWELVRQGVEDLAAGRESIEAMLVATASERLASLGIALPVEPIPTAPERLYQLVAAGVGDRRAHSRYNALRRRLASFLRSAGHAQAD